MLKSEDKKDLAWNVQRLLDEINHTIDDHGEPADGDEEDLLEALDEASDALATLINRLRD